jgi:hypothetical protein
MFTDGPVTPVHLETLVDLLRTTGPGKFDPQALALVLQPESLGSERSQHKQSPMKREQTRQALAAAEQLGLAERQGTFLAITVERKDKRSTRELVVAALESRVLATREVEPYFALFFSYLLGVGKSAGDPKKTREQWASEFNNHVFGGERQANPFNPDKLSGLHRWFRYAGIGWYDPADVFQCNPYERLRRALPAIFEANRKLPGSAFMDRLARICPELDGGAIFRQARPNYDVAERVCTLGLSHALVDLHLDGHIVLHCPQDSSGWSLQEAEPLPLDNQNFRSARIDFVERPRGHRAP